MSYGLKRGNMFPVSVLAQKIEGTFGCNHVRGGFIHIPYLPEQAARHPGAASMSLAEVADGLRIAVQASLTVSHDASLTGGAIH